MYTLDGGLSLGYAFDKRPNRITGLLYFSQRRYHALSTLYIPRAGVCVSGPFGMNIADASFLLIYNHRIRS